MAAQDKLCFPPSTDLWTWGRTHRDCRGWAPACGTSARLHRRRAQWGTQTREGFLPPAQAVDAAAALAPAELFPFPVHWLPGPPTPLYRLSSCVNSPFGGNGTSRSQLLRAMTWHCEATQVINNKVHLLKRLRDSRWCPSKMWTLGQLILDFWDKWQYQYLRKKSKNNIMLKQYMAYNDKLCIANTVSYFLFQLV